MFERREAGEVVINSNICSVWGDAHVCEIEYSESSCDTAVLKREKVLGGRRQDATRRFCRAEICSSLDVSAGEAAAVTL